jgi:hypothetical protein
MVIIYFRLAKIMPFLLGVLMRGGSGALYLMLLVKCP